MEGPSVKSVKIYAVIESKVDLPCEALDDYLRQNRFNGTSTIAYKQGGIRTVITKEHIPLTMDQIDKILAR